MGVLVNDDALRGQRGDVDGVVADAVAGEILQAAVGARQARGGDPRAS